MTDNFLGMEGFKWGIGVVEDRFDPELSGRVRVRWLGLHNEEKEKILTKDLPWSQVMVPATDSQTTGIGDTPNNLTEGTWVVGFARDQLLQEWIVMGMLPGMNTTTGYVGKLNRKWGKQRGTLQEYVKKYSSEIPNLSEKYKDYEKGFHDPTIDLRRIPYPPSDVTIGHSQKFYDYSAGPSEHYPQLHENAFAEPQSYYANSRSGLCGTRPKFVAEPEPFPDPEYIFIPRVPNYKPAGAAPNDLTECVDWKDEDWAQPLPDYIGYAHKFLRITHSDILHYLYRTTRRITADARQCPEGFGTFLWASVCTYGLFQYPGVIVSTGYLEDGYWRADKEAGKAPGGTHAPTWPITRDTPTSAMDASGLAGIDPLDNRANWGKQSGQEIGYFLLEGEEFRLLHPRTKYVQKGKLTPTQRVLIKSLFEAGQYGTGIYNISDDEDPDRRIDIKWKDVKNTDLVVLPEKDVNKLAQGGIPIQSINGDTVVTKVGLYGDDTRFFSQPDEGKNKNTKPLIQKGDVIMISGVRGAEEYNGRIYRCITVTDGGNNFTITLGTQDGLPWSGPGSIEYADTETTTPSIIDAVPLLADYYSLYSAYLGEGVITVNPHWTIRAKAETRERQINIGNPEMNTGINQRFWNQPTSRWAAQYPFNHVYETESGHIKEFDDTPGAERIHEYHRSGTYNEVDHNGTKVDYVKGDNYNIRIFDDYMYVKGKVAWTMDDEVMIRCNDKLDLSAKWKIQIHSGGDLDLSSKRNINMRALGDINMQYDGHMNLFGTAISPETAKYHAGTRKCKDLSALYIKNGWTHLESMEDIRIQSNHNVITLKTLEDDIMICSAVNIQEFSVANHMTYAIGHIDEFSVNYNNRTSMGGDIHDVNLASNIEHYTLGGRIAMESVGGSIDINALGGPISITALTNTIDIYANADLKIRSATASIHGQAARHINLWSGKDTNIQADDRIFATAENDVNIHAGVDLFTKSVKMTHIEADSAIFIESVTSAFNLKSELGIFMLSATQDVHIQANQDMHLETDLGSMNILSYSDSYITTTAGDFNNRVLDITKKIVETAPEIHMNGPIAEMATAADEPALAETATRATKAAQAANLLPMPQPIAACAWIPPTIDVVPTDIPDPDFARGVGLALNPNDPGVPGSGYGGENIRPTHDTINDIIAGESSTSY